MAGVAKARAGVLVLDKPKGPTSHDVVARVRRLLGVREVGHAGTLDPMATGVLVVAIGEATKLAAYLTAQVKAYQATVTLGVATDTLDAFGRETARVPVTEGLRAALLRSRGRRVDPEIARALEAERARTAQVAPEFSAVRMGGERAYEKARRGEKPEMASRPVRVESLKLLDAGDDPAPWLAVDLDVSKGYYVRAFARDLAESLGTVGHLTSLRRTRSGPFLIEEALPLDTPADELEARIMPVAHAALRSLPVAYLTSAGERDARHGRPVLPDDIDVSDPGIYAWIAPGGGLVAIGEVREGGKGQVLRGFASGDEPEREPLVE
jgi:tRNA pseudouridine55 synthase